MTDARHVAREILKDLLWCSRVWSAWGYGTMSEDDFIDAEGDENIFADTVAAIERHGEAVRAMCAEACDKQSERLKGEIAYEEVGGNIVKEEAARRGEAECRGMAARIRALDLRAAGGE